MNLMDDQFFQKIAEDTEACEELLRILLDKPDLKIIENQTQRYLRNVGARSVILDVLCQDDAGNMFNIEVQKDDKQKREQKAEEYQKRVRFNVSNMDTVFAEKGIAYHQLPDIYAVFLSELDPFQQNCTTYHIHRAITETGEHVENGIHEIYVNAAVNDRSDIAELMQYFIDSSGYHPKFEKISQKVVYYKESNKGVTEMVSVFDEYAEEYAKEKVQENEIKVLKDTAAGFLKNGASMELVIKSLPSLPEETIRQLKEQLEMKAVI